MWMNSCKLCFLFICTSSFCFLGFFFFFYISCPIAFSHHFLSPLFSLFRSITQPVQDLNTEVQSCQSKFLFLKMLSFFSEIHQNKWDTHFLVSPFLLWFERRAQQRSREGGLAERKKSDSLMKWVLGVDWGYDQQPGLLLVEKALICLLHITAHTHTQAQAVKMQPHL